MIWRAALVLPQARRVLETQLRKLARGAAILHSSFFILPSSFQCGAAAGNRTRMVAVRKHSAWQEDILLLNHSREIKRAGSFTLPAHAISTKNKHLLVI